MWNVKYFADFVAAKLSPLKVGQVAVVSQSANYFGIFLKYLLPDVYKRSKMRYSPYRSIRSRGAVSLVLRVVN